MEKFIAHYRKTINRKSQHLFILVQELISFDYYN